MIELGETAATTWTFPLLRRTSKDNAACSTSNGRDFLRRKRTTELLSCTFSGRASKSSRSTRMAASGMIAITSLVLLLTASSAPRMALRRAVASWTLGPLNPGVITPWSRRRDVNISRRAGLPEEVRAAMTRSAEISQAKSGRASVWVSRGILPGGLDERDLIDLLQGSYAGFNFGQRGFAQEAHAFFVGCAPDFRRWAFFQDQLADAVRQIQQLMDRGAAVISRASALDAALAFVELHVAPFRQRQTAGFQGLV